MTGTSIPTDAMQFDEGQLMAKHSSPKLFREPLGEHFGFYYTIKKVLFQTKTKHQSLSVAETEEFGRVLALDGITQIAEKVEWAYHEMLAHPPMLLHPKPEKVLVVGGGDGGIAKELLKHPQVKQLTHVELDDKVVGVARRYFPNLSANLDKNPKYNLVIQEGRSFVGSKQNEYDAVVMDMTDPIGPSLRLYTLEYFRLVRRALKRKGLFAMHTESPVSSPKLFAQINQTLAKVFDFQARLYNYVQMYGTLWSVCVASNSSFHATKQTLSRRMNNRNLNNLQLITPDNFLAMQVEAPYILKARSQKTTLLRDASLPK